MKIQTYKKLAYSQHKYGSAIMDKRVLFEANCYISTQHGDLNV